MLFKTGCFFMHLDQWFLTFYRSRTHDEKSLDTADPLSIFFEYKLQHIKASAEPEHEYCGPPGGCVPHVNNH